MNIDINYVFQSMMNMMFVRMTGTMVKPMMAAIMKPQSKSKKALGSTKGSVESALKALHQLCLKAHDVLTGMDPMATRIGKPLKEVIHVPKEIPYEEPVRQPVREPVKVPVRRHSMRGKQRS